MKCHYCGEEVAENQSYCMWCGTRQKPAVKPALEETALPEIFMPAQPAAAEPMQPTFFMPAQPAAAEAVQPEISVPAEPAAEAQLPVFPVRNASPRLQLPTRRGLGKMFFLGILTLCIYPIVIWSRIVTELNIAASRYDGKRTMPYFAMVMLAPFTLGIYALVWMHKFCRRIGDELQRRNIDYKFGPGTFWLWNVLGSLILVGPFIFTHKLMKSMNKINADFNVNG